MRFIAEEQAVHSAGGKIIYVDRPNTTPGNHASEKEVLRLLAKDKFDIIINNNSTEKELFNKVKKVLNDLELL